MFCRRIFSCILLVVIVLSVTRTSFIASAAQASTRDDMPSTQWKTFFDMIQDLLKGKLNSPQKHKFIAIIMSLVKHYANADIIAIIMSLVQHLADSDNAQLFIKPLYCVLEYGELDDPQRLALFAIIMSLSKDHANSANARLFIKSLYYVLDSSHLNGPRKDQFIAEIMSLVKHYVNADIIAIIMSLAEDQSSAANAQLIIESLCYVLEHEELDFFQRIKIIDIIMSSLDKHGNELLNKESLLSVLNSPLLNPDLKNQIKALIETLKSSV